MDNNNYKTTVSQRLIWMDQAAAPGSAKYNIGGYAVLEGALDIDHFKQAIRGVLRSQEIYSVVFAETSGQLQSFLLPAADEYSIEVIDFSRHAEPESAAMLWMEKEFAAVFKVSSHHLFVFKLLKIHDEKYFWYAKIHHLIGDGWSFRLLMNQAAELYTAFRKGDAVELPVYKYSDYAIDDEAYYGSQSATDDRNFWLQEYRELPPPLFQKLPVHHAQQDAGSETLEIDAALKTELQAVADAGKVSLFHLVITVLISYFSRITQQSSIAVGVPVLNRTKKIYRQTAGMFMNLLALKFEIAEDTPVADVLNGIKQKMSACLRHQRYQYGNLVKDLKLPKDRKLLYDIRVSYEDFDFTSEFCGIKASAVALSNLNEVDPLAIYVREYNGRGFDIRFIYNKAFFTQESMRHICGNIKGMLSSFPSNTAMPLRDVPILSEEEKGILLQFSSGGNRQDRYAGFAEIWLEAVDLYPLHIAVSCDQKKFTYQDIHTAASKLAQVLLQRRQHTVGILVQRSEKMVIAMLAAMLAGVTYVPIDNEYPDHRTRFMLKDASCTLLLTEACLMDASILNLPVEILNIDQVLHVADVAQECWFGKPVAENACYIIYTSGSTGQPKGVIVSQASVVDYVTSFREYFNIGEQDVVLQQASVSFDTSVEEIFPILASGGRLHILKERKDLLKLKQLLEEEKISVLSTNPWVVKFLNNEELPSSLRILISGGDVLKPAYTDNILRKGINVYNTYGPTESTVCATYCKVKPGEAVIPIGRPFANRRVYILDKHRHLQPHGTAGEIYIGGKGLALAYTDKALTEEKFVTDPFVAGAKIYRTGDAGVMNPDGMIIFKGRIDEQINFRGYRIEAQEVETAVNGLAGIESSIVTMVENGDAPVLVAYVKTSPANDDNHKIWRRSLADRLPAYMIPEMWIAVDEFPLLPNGKVNKKALPAVDLSLQNTANDEKALPESELEKKLHALWQSILGPQAIGTDDSFFESGGHSLNIIQLIVKVKEQFNIQVNIQDVFEHDTIGKQALLISRDEKGQAAPVQEEEPGSDYPLTPAQTRLWILSQLPEASNAYHISGAIRLQGTVNKALVEQAVTMLVNRHDSLRTVFYENDMGSVRQQILEPSQIKGPVHVHIEVKDQDQCQQLLRSFMAGNFDLSSGPLLRTALIEMNETDFLFVYVLHHIISDGWSMELLLKEFVLIYDALVAHKEPVLPSLGIQLRHFYNNPSRISETQKAASEKYWLHKLNGKLPVTDLPAQHARPAVKNYQGSEVIKYFDNTHYNRLLEFCENEQASLFTGLLATLNVLINRYTGQERTIIGTPVANRYETALQNQVGLLLNMLPLETKFSGAMTFREMLRLQKNELKDSFKYQQYELQELVQKLNLRNDPGRSPLFDILIVLHNQVLINRPGAENPEMGGVAMSIYHDLPRTTSQFDATFAFFYEDDGRIKLRLEYNTSLFDKWFAEQIADHFVQLSQQMLEEPDMPVSRVQYFSNEEQQSLLLKSTVALTDRKEKHFLQSLYALAPQNSGKIAVVCGKRQMTYGSLLQAAEKISNFLIDAFNVQPGDAVAVMLNPDEWLPACILGIWRAGALYVPVNPVYPALRQKMIIDDSACKVVLTAEQLSAIIETADAVTPSKPRFYSNAYILYTSGTTGKPKGVVVSHEALIEKMWVELEIIKPAGPVNSCLTTNYCFDVSFLELLLPLLTSGKIVIPHERLLLRFEELAEGISAEAVNVLHGTPTFVDAFVKYLPQHAFDQLNDSLQVICMGGESLYGRLVSLLKRKLPNVRLNNHYGPTEAVIHAVATADIQRFDKNIIGTPMPGVSGYVLDRQLQPVPRGVNGELFVGGKTALAEGYFNIPEETASRFIDNPFVTGERIYKTGDVVRWNDNYQVEFIGRADDQVKIRGMRIEPEEIQRVFEQYPSIQQAVVIPFGQRDQMILTAFLVSGEIINEGDLRAHLKKYLPDYMIPAVCRQVAELPLNENGKTDKEKLLELAGQPDRSQQTVAPRNEVEEQLVILWQELLSRNAIGVTDNFFDLGGNSILLVKMRAELRKKMDIRLEVKDLLNFSTIEELSETIYSLRWLQQSSTTSGVQVLEEFIV